MVIGNCDFNVGQFYEFYNDESGQRENGLLTDIKLNISGSYATFLTFNGLYKTKDIVLDVILPRGYAEISEQDMLNMISIIVEKTAMNEGLYLEEHILWIKMIITGFIASRKFGD